MQQHNNVSSCLLCQTRSKKEFVIMLSRMPTRLAALFTPPFIPLFPHNSHSEKEKWVTKELSTLQTQVLLHLTLMCGWCHAKWNILINFIDYTCLPAIIWLHQSSHHLWSTSLSPQHDAVTNLFHNGDGVFRGTCSFRFLFCIKAK